METKAITTNRTLDKDMRLLDGHFTADNLIDAYLKGHKDGCKMLVDVKSLLELFKRSSMVINDFYNNRLKNNSCYSLFMKLADKIYLIAVVDKDVYFDEKRSRDIYSYAIGLMKRNPDISISIMPCDNDESINRVSLKADNYIELLS